MDKEDVFDSVWQVWQKEKQSSKLQQIPKSFYEDAMKSVNRTQELQENQKTLQENLIKVLNSVYTKRKQKILVYVAYEQSMPQPLPAIEQQFCEKIKNVVEAERLDKIEEMHDKVFTVTQSVPKIVLPSGREIGPLDNGQLIEVENETDKNFLISNNICRKA